MCVCVYVYVRVFVCVGLCVCVCLCLCRGHRELALYMLWHLLYSLETGSLTKPGACNLAGPLGQQTPLDHLSLPHPKPWGYKCVLLCPAALWVAAQVLRLEQQGHC